MSTDALLHALRHHYDRTWAMWEDEIRNIPEAEWRAGDIDYLIPARHLVHVVVSCDFYTGETPIAHFDWNSYFDGDWEGMTPAALPTREVALAKIAEIRGIMAMRFEQWDDQALAAPQTLAPWTGPTLLDRLLYLLRHLQHHLGELHAELRRRDIPRARWK